MRLLLTIVAAILLLPVALALIGFVFKLTIGLVHLVTALAGIAVAALVVVFVIGLFRRMLRV